MGRQYISFRHECIKKNVFCHVVQKKLETKHEENVMQCKDKKFRHKQPIYCKSTCIA